MKRPLALIALFLPALALAQSPPAQNLISNGSFEFSTPTDNLWDGVDSDGYLAGFRGGAPALTEGGSIGDVAMPISVQAVDLNGDGLLDLVTADPRGYYRVYCNVGTKTEPKFTTGEMIPFFPSGFPDTDWRYPHRFSPKICLADLGNDGKQDLIIGDYYGEILIVPNMGSKTAPEFRQPNDHADYVVKTTKNGNAWGNLFAPAVYDWNHDNKLDLLVGEGSYSANSIHLLLNEGASSQPKFSEQSRYFLAYGDGKEQLVPAVVDYNGDGYPDLLVGDRKGTISVFLSSGPWKPGNELKFSSLISFGSVTSLGGCIAPAVADLNGDGLFDLIIGKANGRIAVAYNKGTKTEPKFDMPIELKGEDLWNRNTIREPSGWSYYNGFERGNIYSQVSVVSADDEKDLNPPDGKSALKFGYFQSPDKVFKYTPVILPGAVNNGQRLWWDYEHPYANQNVFWAGVGSQGNTFIVRKMFTTPPKPGVRYQFSFKVRGHGVKQAIWAIHYDGEGRHSEDKITRGERGRATVERDLSKDSAVEFGNFIPTAAWTTVSKQMTFKFERAKDLNNPDTFKGIEPPKYWACVHLEVLLDNPSGVCYLDDVQFTEK